MILSTAFEINGTNLYRKRKRTAKAIIATITATAKFDHGIFSHLLFAIYFLLSIFYFASPLSRKILISLYPTNKKNPIKAMERIKTIINHIM